MVFSPILPILQPFHCPKIPLWGLISDTLVTGMAHPAASKSSINEGRRQLTGQHSNHFSANQNTQGNIALLYPSKRMPLGTDAIKQESGIVEGPSINGEAPINRELLNGMLESSVIFFEVNVTLDILLIKTHSNLHW